jgi:hypothetical protein
VLGTYFYNLAFLAWINWWFWEYFHFLDLTFCLRVEGFLTYFINNVLNWLYRSTCCGHGLQASWLLSTAISKQNLIFIQKNWYSIGKQINNIKKSWESNQGPLEHLSNALPFRPLRQFNCNL